MSNEQRRVALFQGQPEGPGPFFRLTTLAVAYIESLYGTPAALLAEKMGSGSNNCVVSTGPSQGSGKNCLLGLPISWTELESKPNEWLILPKR